MQKKLFLLIGPKGAGKTYISSLIEKSFGVKFFRVEDVWLKLKNEKNFASEKEYFDKLDEFCKEGNIIVKDKIDELLKIHDSLVIESLGIAPHFDSFLSDLKKVANVVPIKIFANPELCIERVKTRDQSIHIAVSDDKVKEVNEKAFQVKMDFAFEINNVNLSEKDLISMLKPVITTA